jgi:beta-lactamase regulating signal transducer with metallopeptidase domain
MNVLQTLSGAEWLPFLAVLAAKATLVLLLTAAAAALLGRASAAARHMVWCVGVAGVLALPLLAVLLPAWEVPLLRPAQSGDAAAPLAAPLPGEVLVSPPPVSDPVHTETAGAPARPWMPSLSALVAGVIVGGSAVGLLWLAIGFWGVTRLGRSAEVVNDPHWLSAAQDAARRLGLRRPVLLLRSRGAVMPACWGLLWPSVIVPATADAWPEGRKRAVLAHELAHVKRFDCLTQALAQLACVLLWWHPAVWYAARRLRIERERACDDLVLGAGARASEYAAHLLEIARDHRGMGMAAPALVSMARPSHLESRLLWVLDGARARAVPSTRALLLAVLVGTFVVGPLAALRPAAAADGPEAQQASAAPLEPDAYAASPGPDAHAAPVPPDDEAAGGPLPTLVAVSPARGEEAGSVAWIGVGSDPPAGGGLDVGGIVGTALGTLPPVGDAMRSTLAADTPNVTIDALIAMRALGVDARYIQEMRAAGYPDLSNEQLLGMRATGVTSRFVSEMNAAGMGRLTPDELIGLRTMGVTPAFLDALRRRGYTDLRADALTGLRAMGVTPEYIDEMNALGHGRLSADMLIGLKAVGVTAAYVRELERMGLGRPPLGEVKGLRTLGVTGAYVAELRDAGVRPLTAESLAGLRAMGVTGAYVREMAAAGLTDLSADDLTALRAMGVTGAYVREMAAAGYRNLTADRLLDLRAGGDASRHRDRTRRP